MKRFLLFSLLLGAVAFSSCKKDNDDPEPVNPIHGTWHLMEILITDAPPGYGNLEGISLSSSYFFILSDILIINADGSFVVIRNFLFEDVLTLKGSYTFENNRLTLDYDHSSIQNEVYLLNGDGTLDIDIDTQLDLSTQEQENIIDVSTLWIYRKY
jgi:hypothetical protein